jgi:two-component system chemotaxis sensor kinase CheA
MKKKRGYLLSFLSSGKFENLRNEAAPDEIIRYITFNIALLIGASFLILFGITVIMEGETVRGLLDLLVGFVCVVVIFLLRTNIPFAAAAVVPLVFFGSLCALLTLSGGEQGFAGLWIFSYPLLVIFILGMKLGSVLSALLFGAIIIISFVPGVASFNYTLPMAFRMIAVYILVLIVTIVYEQVRIIKDRWLQQLTAALKLERDQITVMKDNMKYGTFLMDKDYIIQPAFSKALEDILGVNDLQGKSFPDILSASIKAKEREMFKDYLAMVINRSFDRAMLDDINPINEFMYINTINGDEKILRTGFAPIDRGHGEFFIMGNLEDITAEKLLQQQLSEEEAKREEEMRSIFEIIQIEPRVFGDFIEDMEYEFDRINEILKNASRSSLDVMVEIYQSIHAIKSNAVILGLENFGKKLHELEAVIKTIQDQMIISFEDILHITLELEKIMQEKDKFQELIEKIKAFRAGEVVKTQDEYVLIQTLTKACEKAADAQNKKVTLAVESIDKDVLNYGPRRVIKEVLTQLIRNAVSHGIETPEERQALGKKETGVIRLSVKVANHKIHVRLTDDGRGLNFKKILQTAKDRHFLKENETAVTKNQLLQILFSPGFSTAESTSVHAGRGIGLNLVLSRIQNINGTIKVASEEGKGTTFHIYLPLEIPADITKAS